MTLLERAVAHIEQDASDEQMEIGRYAERRIDGMTNFRFLQLLSEVLETAETPVEGAV